MVSINDLIIRLLEYNPEEIDRVMVAYEYAKDLHEGQYRQSGEPYITHPLNVALILAEMHADGDTICAGLLHDTLEDTIATKEEISSIFGEGVANLVDGVTKISKMNFSSKQEEVFANTRKIVTGIMDDVRIIIIKLADRLHNMRTLEFKSPFKQKENALETMEIFVPLAYYIGAYRIKQELEDISFKYLMPEMYKTIEEEKNDFSTRYMAEIEGMLLEIKKLLDDENIPNEIKLRTKNIYGIYRQIKKGVKMPDIHDFFALKIVLKEIQDCYRCLYFIHSRYMPINSRFKDYICNPKTNMYQSLHTTVFGPEDRLVQAQIRTYEMDRVASFGLTSYWNINKGDARIVMQDDLRNRFQFFRSLTDIDEMFDDNSDFLDAVKTEVFSDMIYVYMSNGTVIELPKGATPIDLAFKVAREDAGKIVGVVVNDQDVPLDYLLQTKDRVKIEFGKDVLVDSDWGNKAITSNAKVLIKDILKES